MWQSCWCQQSMTWRKATTVTTAASWTTGWPSLRLTSVSVELTASQSFPEPRKSVFLRLTNKSFPEPRKSVFPRVLQISLSQSPAKCLSQSPANKSFPEPCKSIFLRLTNKSFPEFCKLVFPKVLQNKSFPESCK